MGIILKKKIASNNRRNNRSGRCPHILESRTS